MKFVIKSAATDKHYGPFRDFPGLIRWAKKNINQGYEILPVHPVDVPRKKPRKRARLKR